MASPHSEKIIESRTYLLESQKERLMEDLGDVTPDERIEKVIDAIFYKLFGTGWDTLTETEKRDIHDAWKGTQ